jgi:hypothetical protein
MKNHGSEVRSFLTIVVLFLLSEFSLNACHSSNEPLRPEQFGFNSPVVLGNLKTVVPSIIGVSIAATYRVESYHYQMLKGKAIPDSGSPTGYKLLDYGRGIVLSEEERNSQGCSTLIYEDEKVGVVLTCQHIFSMPDTILGYYMGDDGKLSDVIAYRSIKTQTKYFVIDQDDRLHAASLLHANSRFDLALLKTETIKNLGSQFPFSFSYDHDPDWGDPVYMFGYPGSSRQLTIGVASPTQYEGSFVVDGASRAGFSGGPVLGVRVDGTLEFLGVIRAIPSMKLRYISPPPDLPKGAPLFEKDLPKTTVEEENIPEGNASFVINTKIIGIFLTEAKPILDRYHIDLSDSFLPSR